MQMGERGAARLAFQYLARAITTSVTSLPGPAMHCRPGEHVTFYKAETWFGVLDATRGSSAGFCGDLITSGHTYVVVTCLAVAAGDAMKGRPSRARRCILAAASAAVTVFAVMVVAARKHYTVDILLAIPVALYVDPAMERVPHSWCALWRRLLSFERAVLGRWCTRPKSAKTA